MPVPTHPLPITSIMEFLGNARVSSDSTNTIGPALLLMADVQWDGMGKQ